MDSAVEVEYYNFIMNATLPRDFPLDMTMVQKRTVVERDKFVEIFLPHLRGLAFHTNNSVMDSHATVVQIVFFQNRICYNPIKWLENIPLGIEQLYFDSRSLARTAALGAGERR